MTTKATTKDTNAPANGGTILPTPAQTKATAPLSATAKGRKTARQETTKALTAAQTKSLEALVTAAKTSIATVEGKGEHAVQLAAELAGVLNDRDVAKVYGARALHRLSQHPAVVATGGPTKGQPALTKMAALIGRPAQSLQKLWDSARKLNSAGFAMRTQAPTAAELALVSEIFKAESDRVTVSNAKAKASAPGKGKGGNAPKEVTFSSIEGQLDAVIKSLTALVGKGKLSPAQAKVLFSKLDEVTDIAEKNS